MGAARGPNLTYRLVEKGPSGECASETFVAPDDAEALERALDVCDGALNELWRDDLLIRRWPKGG